ncbi:guanine nucleotide exchange factor [Coprinopsis sp. MPI-PUGE-AT-0042]|nr:guanine nucleotide exchange factor [Coprinopsis sp. MPI-PUGE-AT-0042]
MTDIVGRYKALSSSSPRSNVAEVLTSIILAPGPSFNGSSRAELIKLILDDLKSLGKHRLQGQDAAKALLAVKTLGRDPAGSEVISQDMPAFLKFQSTMKDYPDAATEALRCLANALLLIESARHRFLEPTVNGPDVLIPMLDKASSPDQIFILARVLFLAGASGSTRIVNLVETKYNSKYLIDIIAAKVDALIVPVQSSTPMAKDAMTDILKLAFYILVHYPKLTENNEPQAGRSESDSRKVMGDFWSSKLDGLLGCTIRVVLALSPLSPVPLAAPLTHAIHALISIPVSPSLKPVWFPQSAQSSSNNTPRSARTPRDSSRPGSRSSSPASSSPTSPKPSTLDRALSVLSRNRLPRSTSPVITNPMVLVDKALELLDMTLARYFPGKTEADDPSVRDRVKADTPQDSLDELLAPLTVLLARICLGDEAARARVRQFIVPDDLDRSSPLEERQDILGRCLRLLGSMYHARLKDSVGEMLYAMSDNNASTLSGLVGYGNVAGYLFNKGVMSAPSGSDSTAPTTTAKGETINPVTGTILGPKTNASEEMTDEEKEREMEKLIVLFDRLEKTGALPKEQNPIRKGIQEGKLPI